MLRQHVAAVNRHHQQKNHRVWTHWRPPPCPVARSTRCPRSRARRARTTGSASAATSSRRSVRGCNACSSLVLVVGFEPTGNRPVTPLDSFLGPSSSHGQALASRPYPAYRRAKCCPAIRPGALTAPLSARIYLRRFGLCSHSQPHRHSTTLMPSSSPINTTPWMNGLPHSGQTSGGFGLVHPSINKVTSKTQKRNRTIATP